VKILAKEKGGAIIQPDPNKVRITIRLDGDIIEHFKNIVHTAGGGNYQTLINQALRQSIDTQSASLETTLRSIIRDELYEFKKTA
jgi:uncharacterized protein (DUF4415 family)